MVWVWARACVRACARGCVCAFARARFCASVNDRTYVRVTCAGRYTRVYALASMRVPCVYSRVVQVYRVCVRVRVRACTCALVDVCVCAFYFCRRCYRIYMALLYLI